MNKIYNDDCLNVLCKIEENSIDSIICDPPYEMGVMGKKWDNTGIAFDVSVWKHCFRCLKPGGYVIAFSGTKTYHRLAMTIEDAGFEIRDMLLWVYLSGFPKNMNIGKKYGVPIYNNFGTNLKPAHLPIVMARKPIGEKNIILNMRKYTTGVINIDACRIPTKNSKYDDTTRFPANIVVTGLSMGPLISLYFNIDVWEENYGMIVIPKPSRKLKDAGCLSLLKIHPTTTTGRKIGSVGAQCSGYAGMTESTRYNIHPTVKPINLMKWLIRLVTQENSIVLDPFAGSGTTGIACKLMNRNYILILKLKQYYDIAIERLKNY